MDQSFESVRYLLEVILKGKGSYDLRLNGRQNLWIDLYGCLVKKSVERASDIVIHIFGKENYTKTITPKTLQKLCHIVRHIESTAVAKRNQSFSRAAACVLGLAKIISRNQKDRKVEVEVEILYSICLNEDEKLERLLQENHRMEFISTRCKGMTPIHLSVIWNNNNSLTVLLSVVDKKLIDQKDFYGVAPLHYAVLQANVMSTQMLLQSGANANVRLQSNATALHLAAFKVYPDLIFLLCEHGADVHSTDIDGNTPLLVISRSARDLRERIGVHCTGISLLLSYGSSPNAQNRKKETSLHNVSSLCTDTNCAHSLILAGAKLDNDKKFSESREISKFLEKIRKSLPLRLDVLCSIAVRKYLGTSFGSKVKRFQLPREVEMVLLFQKLPKLF